MKDHDDSSVDLQAVHRDDEFLDALAAGGGLPPIDHDEAKLGSILFAWRTETLATPLPQHPTLADVDAALAVQAAERKRKGVARHLRVISGAAAITAVAAAGLLVLSENSQPGDPLWNVKKVVFAEQAQQTQATIDVQSSLESAESALAAGNTAEAAAYVDRAERDLQPIHEGATRDRMEQWIQRLRDDEKRPDPVDRRPATTESSTDPAVPPPLTTDDPTPPTSVTVTVTPSDPPTSPTSPSTPPPTSSSSQPSSTPTSSEHPSATIMRSPVPSS